MGAVKVTIGQVSGRHRPLRPLTAETIRKVLVIVHTAVYGQRLRDVLSVLESDPQIELSFTVAPHTFDAGARRLLRAEGKDELPWEQAISNRFDIALAAGPRGIERVSSPVVLIPHGASHIKLAHIRGPSNIREGRAAHGLSREHLMRDGRVIPKAIVLAHEESRTELSRWCPEALPVAHIIGDPFLDKIKASLPRRTEYRQALGLSKRQKLLLVSSTWQPGSSLSRLKALLPRLEAELPMNRYRVAVTVHPNYWEGVNGPWLISLLKFYKHHRSIKMVAESVDWRQLLIAADWVIGDHGSVTLYGAVTQTPTLLTHFPFTEINTASPAVELPMIASKLSPSVPLMSQLHSATLSYRRENHISIEQRLASEPGEFGRNIRHLLYRFLQLEPPEHPSTTKPLPLLSPFQFGKPTPHSLSTCGTDAFIAAQ